SGTTR
ncbi:hypothetical protein LDE37_11700, partial [Mycobacterium tuberculosis]